MWDALVYHTFLWLFVNIPSRSRVVPRADDPDTPMLMQFCLVKGRLYLQHFLCPESDDHMHNHRWNYMRSFVLSSSYLEERPGGWVRARGRFRTHSMDHMTIHRVVDWGHLCVTLFYMSKEQQPDWGYYPATPLRKAAAISWREYVQRRVPSLETGEITE